jgi:hypothetical protein
MSAVIIRRPVTPTMSVMTESSLMLARLLQPLDMAGLLPAKLLARTHKRAQVLDDRVRNKARPDQAAGHQIGNPHGVVDVRLAAGDVLEVGGIRHNEIEITVAQNVPDRLPIDPGRLHGDMGAARRRQP